MNKHNFKIFAVLSTLSINQTEAKEPKPNIIIIMADDMGYGDLSANTHLESANTPNIDRIAQNGILFTQGYASAAMCLPSRLGMLTGCYPAHQGAYTVNSLQGLPSDRMIISEYLKKEGYRLLHHFLLQMLSEKNLQLLPFYLNKEQILRFCNLTPDLNYYMQLL